MKGCLQENIIERCSIVFGDFLYVYSGSGILECPEGCFPDKEVYPLSLGG